MNLKFANQLDKTLVCPTCMPVQNLDNHPSHTLPQSNLITLEVCSGKLGELIL